MKKIIDINLLFKIFNKLILKYFQIVSSYEEDLTTLKISIQDAGSYLSLNTNYWHLWEVQSHRIISADPQPYISTDEAVLK